MRTQFLNVLSAIVLFVALIAIGGSTTKEIPFKTPGFSWSPSKTVLEKNEITFAIVAPSYKKIEGAASGDWGNTEPFKSFSKSIVGDMEELLTARGYNIRGPFKTRDEMVYADKEACHLALIIDVEPVLSVVSGGWVEQGVSTCNDGSKAHSYRGVLSMYSKINLTAIEPISGEKLWAKSIETSVEQTPQIKSSKSVCGGSGAFLALLTADAALQNPITDLLQGSYSDIMDKIWNHLDPNEFARDKERIIKLKKQ